jgi:hypothetical protein
MNKLVIAVLVVLMMLPFASASIFSDAIHMARIRLGDGGLISGKQTDSYVFVYNENTEGTVRGGKLTMTVMDDGAYGTESDIRIKPNQGVGVTFWNSAEPDYPGERLVKVTFTADDGVRKTKYRYVEFE